MKRRLLLCAVLCMIALYRNAPSSPASSQYPAPCFWGTDLYQRNTSGFFCLFVLFFPNLVNRLHETWERTGIWKTNTQLDQGLSSDSGPHLVTNFVSVLILCSFGVTFFERNKSLLQQFSCFVAFTCCKPASISSMMLPSPCQWQQTNPAIRSNNVQTDRRASDLMWSTLTWALT